MSKNDHHGQCQNINYMKGTRKETKMLERHNSKFSYNFHVRNICDECTDIEDLKTVVVVSLKSAFLKIFLTIFKKSPGLDRTFTYLRIFVTSR